MFVKNNKNKTHYNKLHNYTLLQTFHLSWYLTNFHIKVNVDLNLY